MNRTQVDYVILTERQQAKITHWLVNNARGDWNYGEHYESVLFDDPADATLFSLRWL